ncbi:YeaC family protein [Halomonas shantousis]
MGEMTFDRMVSQMTPAIYESLKQAVQLRKWPDGRRLTPEQTELCLEAVIKYEAEHKVPEEQRVGYIGTVNCKSENPQDGDAIKWVN